MPNDQLDTAGAVSAYLNPTQDQPARAAKASMSVALDANPDLEAELRQAAARTGVPIDSARAFPDDIKRQATLASHDFDAMAQQFPGTTKFLADPDNARISHDDVANMSSTESTVGPIRGPKPTFTSYASGLLNALPAGLGMAREGIRMQLADLFGTMGVPGAASVRDDARRKYGQIALENMVETPDFQSSTAKGVYGGLTSTIQQVPAIAAGIATGGATAGLAVLGATSQATAYGKYRQRGGSGGEALAGSVLEAGVEVGTELLPMSFLVKNMGKTGAGHFLTGLLAREIPGEQIATVVQDAIDTAIANPDKTWAQYLAERPDAAYQTLLATVTQAGVMGGTHKVMQRYAGRQQEADHANKMGDALAQFNTLAEASKVRERDTGTAQAFFQSLMQDGRDTVWITPQALAESGILEQVAQAIPGVAQQLEQAGVTGNEIKIPVSDLMANLAGPEIANAIIPHLADEPGGFTQTTANEYLQSGAAQELAAEVARVMGTKAQDDAFNASRDVVSAGMLEQLNTAGRFAPQVNQAYASMIGNFFAVQAAKLGITPEEMAARYPLQVKAESMPGLRTLEQAGTVKSLVDSLQEKFPDLKLDVSESRGKINVSRIVLPKEQRGQGTGTEVMQALIAHADATGQTLTLTPAADFGGSVPRLKKFYKALGFVENKGKHKDFTISESMYRPPAGPKLDEDTGLPLNNDGTVTVYHHTSAANAEAIRKSGTLKAQAEPDVYVTSRRETDTGYGDTAVPVRIDPKKLRLDDEFPDGRKDFSISAGKPGGSVKVKIDNTLNQSGQNLAIDPHQGRWQRDTTQRWDLPWSKLKELNRAGKVNADDVATYKAIAKGDEAQAVAKLEKLVKEIKQRPAPSVTDTPEFKAWFGDSKVTKPDGSPMVVYHGTDKDFDTFDATVRGGRQRYFFAADAGVASEYGGTSGGQNVMPVYVKLENPLVFNNDGRPYTHIYLNELPQDIAALIPEAQILRGRSDAEPVVSLASVAHAAESAGMDGVIAHETRDGGGAYGDNTATSIYIAFQKEQIKSATGNDGSFDAHDPSIVSQGERGSLSFGDDITKQPSVITLLAGADLSTFLHESGHFFLEVLNDVASRPDAPAEIRADMEALLKWFGVDSIEAWNALDLEGKREFHEQFARGFEAYLFEGKAPTSELQGLFSRFRSWMVNVYKSLTNLNVELTPEVRAVFGRMLASSEAIAQAEREAGFAGMFGTKPDIMSDEEWTAYRALTLQAASDAVHELEGRSLKDMQWLGNAKAKVLRDLQREHNYKRAQIHNEVRKEVMSQPEYQAWQFLTLRGSDSTRAWPTPEFKLDPKHVDTRVDNLYTAIAKMGGLNRDEVKTKWGVDHKDMPDSGVFGKPILRKSGGLSIERMAEKLVEDHYLDEHDLAEFEDKFDRQRGGQDQYSWEYQYSNGERAPVEPMGDSNYHGKLHTPMLRHMFGEDSDVVQRLIKARMTSTDGGLDPDIVAEMVPGFASGREMVDAILAVPPPSTMINQLVDQRMLERFGDLTDQASIDAAVNEALHQKAHAKFVATEMAALRKAAGQPAVLAKAAKMYAEQIVRRTVIGELRPDLFTAAAKRAGQAADKAFTKGDIEEAAAQKQIQLINTYAAKAAIDAKAEVEKTLVRFKTITNGNNEKVAKTRDLDMVQATRAILAEFGVGTRGKKATEYLAAVDAYDPAMSAVLRERIDAATENALPIKQLTVEQLAALRDEVESLWYLAKRSRQMEVDGDLLDRQDIQAQLRERMIEIGVLELTLGELHAITPRQVNLSKLQTLRASMRRVEAWAGAKDGSEAMGPFRRYIWNPIKDPADAYRVAKAAHLKQYRALLDAVAPSLTQVKIAAPEINYTFGWDNGGMGKVELLHAVLHTGNAGNKRKLLLAEGRKWGELTPDGALDTRKWDTFIARMIAEGVLTRADFDFAQGVWNLLESMKPAAQKAHRDAFGRYFDEVTAEPFTITMKGGGQVHYAGGYIPAIVDPRIVTDAKTRAILEEQTAAMMNVLPSTSKGFTKARVEYNRPLLLDLRLLSQHIDKVLLFTHLEQPVRDVRRILGSSAVSTPLNKIDPAAYDGLLTPWLNRAARQQVETPVAGDNGTMRFFSVVRSRAGMAAMFANVSNTVQQITGFSLAALRVKPVHLMGAAATFMRSPRELAATVSAASPYMANRMENEAGAMTDAINDILLNPNVYQSAKAWGARHTYFLQSAVDNVMGPIIWQGAYNQAMETAPAGLSEPEIALYARRLADSAVRETQGSTLPEDISRIETGTAFVRLFTQFAGYFNMQANLLGTEFARIPKDMGLRNGLGRGFYVMMFGFLAPAWVAQAIALGFRGGPDDEDKDGAYLDDWLAEVFGWGTLRATTALVPVVGQGFNALANTFNKKPYDDKISTGPAIAMIESAVSVPSDVYKLAAGTGSPTKTVRDVATLVTLLTGIPLAGMARPVVYATEVASGKAKPTGPVDATRGAITGAASPASKGR